MVQPNFFADVLAIGAGDQQAADRAYRMFTAFANSDSQGADARADRGQADPASSARAAGAAPE